MEINLSIQQGWLELLGNKMRRNSFFSTLKVGLHKNYVLVCYMGDMIFVDARNADLWNSRCRMYSFKGDCLRKIMNLKGRDRNRKNA